MNNFCECRLVTQLPVSFDIALVHDIFAVDTDYSVLVSKDDCYRRRLIIIDEKVDLLFGDNIRTHCKHYGIDAIFFSISATENDKNIQTLMLILEKLEEFKPQRRNEPIIAVGGGALLDMVGFASSIYRRGIPYIKIPTTLVGLVDASVGAKTAINFSNKRNRLGTYYPPVFSYLDKNFLKTLDLLEISSGLGEIIKIAVIKDVKLFNILEKYCEKLYLTKFLDCEAADEVIYRSIVDMKDELQDNLWEKNLERCVDFGHSFSPIIEMKSLIDDNVQSLTHGQAVALDVILSCVLSHNRSLLKEEELVRVINVINKSNLPIMHPYFSNIELLMESLADTIKHRNGNQNLPIPIEIGEYVFINDVTQNEIVDAIKTMSHFCKQEKIK
ncbi:sedoheptulose 7-phosphate cyclase [Campylobacter lari]|nr:sedoheptulose 7-phosphate cyclase [Campylobacter lari]EGK8030840.1 sedoheptulose 7-phosphate cyclase [Campylobacter lari]